MLKKKVSKQTTFAVPKSKATQGGDYSFFWDSMAQKWRTNRPICFLLFPLDWQGNSCTREFVKCFGSLWIKDAVNTPDVVGILLWSITWNHCHCVGGRWMAQPFLRRGREGEDSPLHRWAGHLLGWVIFSTAAKPPREKLHTRPIQGGLRQSPSLQGWESREPSGSGVLGVGPTPQERGGGSGTSEGAPAAADARRATGGAAPGRGSGARLGRRARGTAREGGRAGAPRRPVAGKARAPRPAAWGRGGRACGLLGEFSPGLACGSRPGPQPGVPGAEKRLTGKARIRILVSFRLPVPLLRFDMVLVPSPAAASGRTPRRRCHI